MQSKYATRKPDRSFRKPNSVPIIPVWEVGGVCEIKSVNRHSMISDGAVSS